MTFKPSSIGLFSCIVFFIFCSTTIFAQHEALQSDPSITWIAEFTIDHTLSMDVPSSEEIVKLVKFYEDPANTDGFNSTNWVTNWIVNAAMQGQSECYKDPGLTTKLSTNELSQMLSSIDTITTFHADTYEEVVSIVRYDLPIEQIKYLRTNQIIYYNNKTKDFETKLISVSPLFSYEADKSPQPLFWIKMNNTIPSNFNIQAPEITWGALAYSKSNPLSLNFLEVIKNTENINLSDFILEQGKKMEKPVESSQSYGCKNFLTKTEVHNMYNSIDTVITFSPDTYEERIMIVKNEIEPNDISQYRLVQEWYYDHEKKKLMNRLKAIAPIINIHDENGSFKYSKPLYYIRYNSWQ